MGRGTRSRGWLLRLGAFAVMAACGDSGGAGLGDAGPGDLEGDAGSAQEVRLTVFPNPVDFGGVVVGSTEIVELQLCASAGPRVPIEVDDLENLVLLRDWARSDPTPFALELGPNGDFSSGLAGPGCLPGRLRFRPRSVAQLTGGFTLGWCEAPECQLSVEVRGVGVEGPLDCGPDTLAFGTVRPGNSDSMELECRNVTGQPIQVQSVDFGPGTDPAFELDAHALRSGSSLRPGGTGRLRVDFRPDAIGVAQGSLRILTSPGPRERVIPLSGRGGGADLDVRRRIDFGRVAIGAPARRVLELRSGGPEALELQRVELSTGMDFRLQPPARTRVPPGEVERLVVELDPSFEGPVSDAIVIESNDLWADRVEIVLSGEGVRLEPCVYDWAPASLDFEDVGVNRTVRRAIELENRSDADCLVGGVEIVADSEGAFASPLEATGGWGRDTASAVVPPGARLAIPVDFAPLRLGDHAARLELSISDPSAPRVSLPLSGRGFEAPVLIAPDVVDFGRVPPGETSSVRLVRMHNPSSTSWVVQSVELLQSSDVFELVEEVPTPLRIEARRTETFAVRFRPDAVGDRVGAARIEVIEGGDHVIGLLGEGSTERTEDRFEQLGRPRVDVSFVVDDSRSAEDELDAVVASLEELFTFPESQALDFAIAVTRGVLVGAPGPEAGFSIPRSGSRGDVVRTDDALDPAAVLGRNLDVVPRSGTRAGYLEAARLALDASRVVGPNRGWMRRDAYLAVVVITDRDDRSVGSLQMFADALRAVRGFSRQNELSFSVLSGGEEGCTGPRGAVEAAPRLSELVEVLSGAQASICDDDLGRALEDLSRPTFGFRNRFFLTQVPDFPELEVFIDGEKVPGVESSGRINWTANPDARFIRFTPLAVPSPGSRIGARYPRFPLDETP